MVVVLVIRWVVKIKKIIMHTIKNVYLRYYTKNKYDTCMHDLMAIYKKVMKSIESTSKHYFDKERNHKYYPNKHKMSDMEIIALSKTAECLEITSENLLFSKIRSDYAFHFKNLIHRVSYNRRRKRLVELSKNCLNNFSDILVDNISSTQLIIDSIPQVSKINLANKNSGSE